MLCLIEYHKSCMNMKNQNTQLIFFHMLSMDTVAKEIFLATFYAKKLLLFWSGSMPVNLPF